MWLLHKRKDCVPLLPPPWTCTSCWAQVWPLTATGHWRKLWRDQSGPVPGKSRMPRQRTDPGSQKQQERHKTKKWERNITKIQVHVWSFINVTFIKHTMPSTFLICFSWSCTKPWGKKKSQQWDEWSILHNDAHQGKTKTLGLWKRRPSHPHHLSWKCQH